MKRSYKALAVLVGVGALAAPVQAWVNNTGTCPFGSSDSLWPGSSKAVELCTDWNELTNSTVPAADKEWGDVVQALKSAHWVWYRDGQARFNLWLHTTGVYCGSGWFDNGDEVNELGVISSTRSDYLNECNVDNTDPLACTAWDHKDCVGWGDNDLLAADMVFSSDQPWDIVSQNTLDRCLQMSTKNLEDTTIHELGHAYGLDHNEAQVATMNTQKPRVRNCDVSDHFHDYPMPDDMGGFMQHHQGYSGTTFNVAGSPWFKSGATASMTRAWITFTPTSASTVPLTLNYSLHSYYPDRIASYKVSYFWMVFDWNTWTWTVPTFNASTKQWSTPNAIFTPEATIAQNSGRSTKNQAVQLQFVRDEFPVNFYWRLWVKVDSSNQVSERNEGDNVFPTDIVVGRTP